jgi:hypothetical protein
VFFIIAESSNKSAAGAICARFSKASDQEGDLYVCPTGKQLRKRLRPFAVPRSGVTKDNTVRYRASQRDCGACALKAKCCPNTPARKVPRPIFKAARDKARAIAQTEVYLVSRREAIGFFNTIGRERQFVVRDWNDSVGGKRPRA